MGKRRLKYTFANVIYITDSSGTKEVTSYAEPVLVDTVSITTCMRRQHEEARRVIALQPEKWTSHAVIVIDQSGSMKRSDMADCRNRADAVWVCLALDWVGTQLDDAKARGTDVVSIIAMTDDATIILQEEPVDWILYNRILEFRESKVPHSYGDYLPALAAAEKLFHKNKCGSCALQLLFLSDGRPSDIVAGSPARDDQTAWRTISDTQRATIEREHIALITDRVGALASRFGRRLTFGTIGVGKAKGDFEVLRQMTTAAAEYGAIASFKMPSLTSCSLGEAMTSLASSLTDTRTEMTVLGGSTQRQVRDVRREKRRAR